MTPKVPLLSERMREGCGSGSCRCKRPTGQHTQGPCMCGDQRGRDADEVSALEARLAAAEGLVERWRKDATEWAGCEECTGAERTLKDCADELSAILKGEGK